MKIPPKLIRIHKSLINRHFAFHGEICLIANRFDAFLYPGFLCRVLNMHEFNTNSSTIGFAQSINNFSERSCFQTQHMINENRAFPIMITEPIAFRIKFWM